MRLKGNCAAAGTTDEKLKDVLSLAWSPEPVLTSLLKSVLFFNAQSYECIDAASMEENQIVQRNFRFFRII